MEKTPYTFFGWVDATELETTFQVDTSLVKTKSWTSVSSKPASVTGYFYKDISGAPVFKITQIVPIEEDTDSFVPLDDLNYYEN